MLSTMPVSGTIDAEDRVELVRRVLTRLPEEKVIALYISALALSGRVEQSLPHVERLRVFAVTTERYRDAEDLVLRSIASKGAEVQPLRSKLASLR